MFYHIGDSLKKKYGYVRILGMNDGNWHRLDNVFAILGFQALFFRLFIRDSRDLDHNQRDIVELIRWCFLAFTLWCQECSPWDVKMTIIPIVAALIFVVIWYIAYPEKRVRFYRKRLIAGIISMIIAIVFFVRGLDDERDWLRLNHGLWHAFGGLGVGLMCMSVRSKYSEKLL